MLFEGYGPVWRKDIMTRPAVYMEAPHSTIKLRCDADGRPRPTIKWFKDGQQLITRPHGGKVRILVPTELTMGCDERV